MAWSCVSVGVYAQTKTQKILLENAAKDHQKKEAQSLQKALSLAAQKGWDVSKKLPNGSLAFLMGVDERGLPVYFATENNIIAAATTGTNHLWAGGSSGLNLSGSLPALKDKIAVWDGGSVLASHVEFGGRVTQVDGAPTLSDHSTHVAGTMIAAGVNPNVRGMSYGVQGLLAFDFDAHSSEMLTQAANLLISNHSYGTLSGWNFNTNANRWEYYGEPNSTEDYKFGYYNSEAQLFDSMAYNSPYYLIVKSSGNNRGSTGPAVGTAYWGYNNNGNMVSLGSRPEGISSNNGYDIIATYGTAKNILTVGAVNGIPSGYNNANDVVMSSFSSWGPTDDGRIKPDIVADGVNLTSTSSTSPTSYTIMSGTSMATPNTSGSLLLLQEYYAQLHSGSFMRSATLKGLAIHTAEESGTTPGPDYRFGWGLLNVNKAANVIKSNNVGTHQIFENVLQNGTSFTMNISASGPITATLVWTDPKGTVNTSNVLNNPTLKLVNDLDMRITDGVNTFSPWILDPANPANAATKGDNFRDNVERINIDNPTPGFSYTLTINHKGTLQRGSQAYSLIISGVNGQVFCASGPVNTSGARIQKVSFGSINHTNPGSCTSYSDFSHVTTNVESNQTLPLTVQLNSCDATSVDKVVKVYIDFNNNGNFTDPGENVATSGVLNGNATFNANVSIPSTVVVGNSTKMRIVAVETSSPDDVQPCGTYGRGETQDYRLIYAVPSTDLGVQSIVAPQASSCANNQQLVTIRVKNTGLVARDNVPLGAKIMNGTTVVATLSGTYAPSIGVGESKDFTFQAPFNAEAGVTYTIKGYVGDPGDQNRNNDTVTSNIAVIGAGAAILADGAICGTEATLQVTNPTSSNYFWYTSATGNPIGRGIQLTTPTIPANNTYFVSLGARGSAGLSSASLQPAGDYLTNTDQYMKYTSASAVILDNVRLYSKYPGKVEIIVATITNETPTSYSYTAISSKVIDVMASSPNPGPGLQIGYDANDPGLVYEVNLLLPASTGSHAIIVKTQGSTNLFASTAVSGAPYPFAIPGLISITGNSKSAAGTHQGFYYFLYDMKVRSSDCPSPKAQVVAPALSKPVITQVGDSLFSNIGTGAQWLLNGNPIAGANGIKIKPTQSGNYTIRVSSGTCQQTSDAVNVVLTSVGNIPDAIALSIAPNPNRGVFTLRFRVAAREDVRIDVLNAHGQVVYRRDYPKFMGNFSETIQGGNLAAGAYLVRIQQGSKTYTKKIIVE